MKKGFTLVELLVVVLIIGVLTAIAIPQYQTAVDKSRYATLMPMAKSVASAQEAFWLANGSYSNDFSHLDVQLPNNPTGSSADVGDGINVEISEQEDYDYVKMSKDNLENNYVIYQDKSANFPSEIHCEALTDSARAKRLCETLGGRKIDGNLTAGYDTYVLEGEGLGVSASIASAASGPFGWQQCDTYPCSKSCDREVKAGYTCTGTYNENHTYNELVCQWDICTSIDYTAEDKKTTRDTCVMSGDVCNVKNSKTYDENGNLLADHTCSANNADGTCSSYSGGYDYTYDGNSNQTSRRYCNASNMQADGTCSKYSNGEDYTYDSNNKKTSYLYCSEFNTDGSCNSYSSRQEYTYDENGNQTSYRSCGTSAAVQSDGTCSSYSRGYDYSYDSYGNRISEVDCNNNDIQENGACSSYSQGKYYTYDENGNKTSQRSCSGSNIQADGTCISYTGEGYDYIYDGNGHMSLRRCSGSNLQADGTCSSYGYGADYTLDANGNQTSYRECSAGINADGTCTTYRGNGFDATYDGNSNKTSDLTCSRFNADGSCKYSGGVYYTYDGNGNKTSQLSCSGSNIQADGTCSSYSMRKEYTYDENGNQTSYRSCRTSAIQSDGSCSSYSMGTDYAQDEQGNPTAQRTCSSWSGTTCTSWGEWTSFQ